MKKILKIHLLLKESPEPKSGGGGGNAGDNFSSNTRIVGPKNVEKKVGKKYEKKFFIVTRISLEITFFYIHKNIVNKNGGKISAKKIFQKHTISANKKCWGKKSSEKLRKNFFYIHTNIVT